MSLIDDILSRENLNRAFMRVKANKGCAGIDNMPVSELKEYIMENRELIITSIREKKYKPQCESFAPVRHRVLRLHQ